MKCFSVVNLTKQDMVECVPWEFTPGVQPSDRIRQDKQSRQEWYRTGNTEWQFYTPVEPANPRQRPSKDNPAKYLHGIVADYDLPLTNERAFEAFDDLKFKPSRLERSLGGNLRLVWEFERPVLVESDKFCNAFLIDAKKWLNVDALPGLDEGAFEDCNRLYCNGGQWVEVTGAKPIRETAIQSFYFEVSKNYRWAGDGLRAEIPLDIVEAELRKKFPGFSWPGEFAAETQGPSFWVTGSTSPMSAVVKVEGMLTFAAHAEKPFYSWSDILGKEFVEEYEAQSLSKATSGIYYSGKLYYMPIKGEYCTITEKELARFLKIDCSIPPKKHDEILRHLDVNCRISGAAPFLFRESGLIEFQGQRVLNTFKSSLIHPSEQACEWGENGSFPWLSQHFDTLFDPPEQKVWFLAWLKHFYISGLFNKPRPGQNIYLMGPTNTGKTFTGRHIVGRLMGGFVDATDYLVKGDGFGSENYHVPVWCIDDETPNNSLGQDRFFAMLKKSSANQQFKYHKKYDIPVVVEWMGRTIVTCNLDFVSSRILTPMDNSSKDKTCLFRCSARAFVSPGWDELQAILVKELPCFARWLLLWEVPAEIPRHGRYGYAEHHEASLLDQSHQIGRSAPFKELLIEALKMYFTDNPKEATWRGTGSQILRLLQMNPMNDAIIRGLKMEQLNRYLEQIQREGLIQCQVDIGELKTRIWIFSRWETKPDPSPEPPQTEPPKGLTIFSQ